MGGRRTWRWVTRDPIDDCYDVIIWESGRPKPRLVTKLSGNELWEQASGDAEYSEYDYDLFRSLHGISIPTNKAVKVDFKAKIVG